MGMPMITGGRNDAEVQFALGRASAAVESYCERSFAQVLGDVVVIDPQVGNGGKGRAMLPNPPVTNVSSVQALVAVGGSLQWIGLTNFGWAEDGLLFDTNQFMGEHGVTGSSFWSGVANAQGDFDYDDVASWPFLPRSLKVTYDHGYVLPGSDGDGPVLPSGIVDAVIAAAAYYLSNPTGAVDERTGDVATKWEPVVTSQSISGILDSTLLGNYRLVSL